MVLGALFFANSRWKRLKEADCHSMKRVVLEVEYGLDQGSAKYGPQAASDPNCPAVRPPADLPTLPLHIRPQIQFEAEVYKTDEFGAE